MQLLVQLRRRYTALNESFDLTKQMAEMLDRKDRASFALLVSMRQDCIVRLQELDQNIEGIVARLSPVEAEKWQALLSGVPLMGQTEQLLAKQIMQNRRIIEQLQPLDARLSKFLTARKK